MNFYHETLKRTEAAREKNIVDFKKRNTGLYWSICEEKLWPDIQVEIEKEAGLGNNSSIYLVKWKLFSESSKIKPYDSEICNIIDCLILYLWKRGFEASRHNIIGLENEDHVKIEWLYTTKN